ncbi:glycosyltransferase [bacterium]|nr:glycosyltransferase [bacterium]
MKVCVIIPAYNAAETIGIVLTALRQQTFTDFDIILVDDASTDETAAIAETYQTQLNLRILKAPENLGRSRARDFGIKESPAELILLLDSDIETTSDYVAAHVALHQKSLNAVGVGVLRYPSHLAGRALANYYSSRGGARLKPGEPLPGKAFVSCLASFRRTLYDQIGGFDHRFKVYGGEDLDLGLRFQKAGSAMTYLQEAVGYHHHLRSVLEVMQTLQSYGEQGIPLVFDRHPEFAVEMKLEDLQKGSPRIWRALITSPIFYYPLLSVVHLLQRHKLPLSLLTYLIYCAYRKGFSRYTRSAKVKP